MKHSFAEQSKHIFCIHGNLEDMICANNLRKEKFNEFLSEYLRHELGFDTVVFYLAARGMRVYDESSARILADNAPAEETAGDPADGLAEMADDDFDESEFDWDNDIDAGDMQELPSSGGDDDLPEGQTVQSGSSHGKGKTVYTARIEVTDFIAMLDARLKDSSEKIAFVFESISDYINVNNDCGRQFSATLHYLLSDALDDNENRVIFLAMNQDVHQIYSEAAGDDILRGILFSENQGNPAYNPETMISVGGPGRDEIENLLEHYRLYGSGRALGKKFLDYPLSELPDLAYLLRQYMTASGENRLSRLNELLSDWMSRQSEEKVRFCRESARALFPKVQPVRLPEDVLKEMPYAAPVYHRMSVLKKYGALEEDSGSMYDIERFTKLEKPGMDRAKRFLVSGIEHSGRSEAARAVADYLYYIGEVRSDIPVVVRETELLQLSPENVRGTLRQWIRQAGQSVLIVDDMEALLEAPAHQQLLTAFHQTFLQELEHNRMMHFIFIVNQSKMASVFGKWLESYRIQEENRLVTTRKATVPEEKETDGRGASER